MSNKDREQNQVNPLKKVIEELSAAQSQDVPLKWFQFVEKLKNTDRKWMTRNEIQEVAKEVGVKSAKDALQFFHDVGDVVFFEDVPDFVVVQPQWLIDMMGKVITIPSVHDQMKFKDGTKHWGDLEEKGILLEEMARAVWPEGTMDGLVAIMMKYALLLPVPKDHALSYIQKEKTGEKVYFVPSLLSPKPKQSIHTVTESSKDKVLPVMLVFLDNFIPVGFTSRLITGLINEDHWVTVGQMYKDAATFAVLRLKQTLVLTLFQKDGMVEVNCETSRDKVGNLLHESLLVIIRRLKALGRHQVVTFGIHCGQCGSLIEIPGPDANLEDIVICTEKGCEIDKSRYRAWFKTGKDCTDVSTLQVVRVTHHNVS